MRSGICLFLMMIALAIAGCGSSHGDAGGDDTAVCAPLSAEEAWVDSVLASMTLEEMAGQLVMPGMYTRTDELSIRQVRRYIADYSVGGIVLLKGTLDDARRLSDTISSLGSPRLWIALDAEWGPGMRLEGASTFPMNGDLDPATQDNQMYEYGKAVGEECRAIGINMVLGPVMDVVTDPSGSAIGRRSFGGDPDRVARLGVAYSCGLEDAGVISVAKHFPGLGSPRGDTHKQLQSIDKPLSELDSVDLEPFRRYVDAGLSAVMTGHLAVPAIDPQHRPASVSPIVINQLLRRELAFEGLVLTDALNMGGARGSGAVDALLAGADIVLCPDNTDEAVAQIMDAVKTRRLSVSELRDKCRRILAYKYRFIP